MLNQTDQHIKDKFPSLLECAFCIRKKMNLTALFLSTVQNTEQSLSKPAGNKLV